MRKCKSKLILVIDDSAENQILLKTLLEANGYRVEIASNGLEALGILHELTILPDLIFLDAHMPVMSGQEFRLEQLKDLHIKDIPVVFMSGDERVKFTQAIDQPYAILTKPLSVKKVLQTILQLIPNAKCEAT